MSETRATLAPIPVTIVAGFLGAGKTTLLNHILNSNHGLRIAVVVNDFGSINIDTDLVSDVNEGMVNLANGCICCVIRSDLVSAVLKLAEGPNKLDHIVIESSGVADPASVVRAFTLPELRSAVLLDGVITVVDSQQLLSTPAELEKLIRLQISGGDLIVLNKTDLVDREILSKVKDRISSMKTGVQILETNHCRLPVEILLGLIASQDDIKERPSHNHQHEDLFESWTFESSVPLKISLFQQVLSHLPPSIYRVKGFLYTLEKSHRQLLVQLTGRRALISVESPWNDKTPGTRLVFISGKDKVNYPAIEKALQECIPQK